MILVKSFASQFCIKDLSCSTVPGHLSCCYYSSLQICLIEYEQCLVGCRTFGQNNITKMYKIEAQRKSGTFDVSPYHTLYQCLEARIRKTSGPNLARGPQFAHVQCKIWYPFFFFFCRTGHCKVNCQCFQTPLLQTHKWCIVGCMLLGYRVRSILALYFLYLPIVILTVPLHLSKITTDRTIVRLCPLWPAGYMNSPVGLCLIQRGVCSFSFTKIKANFQTIHFCLIFSPLCRRFVDESLGDMCVLNTDLLSIWLVAELTASLRMPFSCCSLPS